jgi:hypothetical protein
MLNRITSGWTWLETALNAMIDEINRQKPLASASIALEESPNGTLLKVTQPQQPATGGGDVDPTPWATTPDGETADWHQLISFNADNAKVSTQWVWGGTPKPGTVYAWHPVGLIDPSTCAQYTLVILTK